MFFDMNYLLWVMIPTLIISGAVQAYMSSTFSKWRNVSNGAGLTGAQVAQTLFQRTSLEPVQLIGVPGKLSDHFDPSNNTVGLSQDIAQGTSVASMAVAAHELGHLQQHQQKSPLMALRSFLVPAVRFSPSISYALIIGGFLLNVAGLAWIGVIVFSLSVIFMLVTVPVEMNASNRAMRLLTEAGLLTNEDDRRGARSVLNAAALTYVAAAVTSILQLLYYVSLVQRNSRR
ncbi:MAG TPA: zinc metallopeptidase [Candidatus Limnocylindrales bacterium]|nr:zinc metallopeptidase [Candidatus Limnocylindrales bacterium]